MRFTQITALNPAGVPIDNPVSEQQLRAVVRDILEANVLCSLATVTPDGRAHVNIAYFGYSEELELYFLSHPQSVHCANLSRNPSAAAAVFSSVQEWAVADRGLQLFGVCRPAGDDDLAQAEDLYAARFAGYRAWNKSAAGEESNYRLYRFIARSVKLLDERTLGDGVIVSATVIRE